MDIYHVEYAQPVEATSASNDSESKPTTAESSGSPPVAEFSNSRGPENVPGCVSLPINPSPERQLVVTGGSSGAGVNSFHSLREFRLKKPNRSLDFVTGETPPMHLVPRTRRSQSTTSTTIPIGFIHGFFTLPLNPTMSSVTGIKIKPYKNHTFSLFPTVSPDLTRMIRVRNSATESASSGSEQARVTPNPCSGLQCGPHEAPRPVEPYRVPRKSTPAIFHDQFTQFMEDRMVMFRPTSSQNNVEQSLNSNHPYQQADEVETIHLRSWFTLNAQRNSNQRVSPQNEPTAGVSFDSPTSPIPANNSTSSFLPRGVQGPCSAEPGNAAMVYTPMAVPLSDVKRPALSPTPSQCLCIWWPF